MSYEAQVKFIKRVQKLFVLDPVVSTECANSCDPGVWCPTTARLWQGFALLHGFSQYESTQIPSRFDPRIEALVEAEKQKAKEAKDAKKAGKTEKQKTNEPKVATKKKSTTKGDKNE